MKNHILDDLSHARPNNIRPILQISLVAIVTILIFLLSNKFQDFVPEYFIDLEGIRFNSIGTLVIVVLTINTILTTNFLNKFEPSLNRYKVVFFAGIVLFITDFVFQYLLIYLSRPNHFRLNLLQILQASGIVSIFAMLISNIRIHKLRKKKRLIPILIFILAWVGFGYYITR